MFSTTQVVNAIRRSQYANASVAKVSAGRAPHLEAGQQNKSFDKRPQQEQGKKFSEVLNEALKR